MSFSTTALLRSTLVVMVATGVAVTAAQEPAATPNSTFGAPPAGALIAPGAAPNLTLLYTGNVVGYLDPCG